MSDADKPARKWRFYAWNGKGREVRLMKNITFSADEKLIEAARRRARAEHSTLNEQFRLWLADYARDYRQAQRAMATVEELRGKLRTGGRKFTREEMNER